MKDLIEGIGLSIYSALLVIVFVGLVSAVGYAAWAGLLPWQYQVQRNAVEQSKSYIDSANEMMQNQIIDYNKANATEGQKAADLNAICQKLNNMAPGTAAPNITAFVATHGGCR